MKGRSLILAAVSMGVVSLAPIPRVDAHDCCHGRHDCPMMSSGKTGTTQAPDPAGGRVYDPETVSTVQGTASAVMIVAGRGGRSGGTHVTLESAEETVDVRLGPAWFLERKGVEIAKGDSLEVTGSVIGSDGDSFLIARELRKGDKVVTLRDENGIPLWSGGRP